MEKIFLKILYMISLIEKTLDQLNGNDKVQIYEVSNLTKHLSYIEKKNITELNISSKPIKIEYISKKFFNIKLTKKKL